MELTVISAEQAQRLRAAPACRKRSPVTCRLSGHFLAALGAAPAGLDAFVHVADPLAIVGAFLADFRALAAHVLVVRGIQKHEMRRRPADLGACHHQAEMPRLDVLSSSFQAVGHRRPETRLVALQAFVDAVLHFLAKLMHGFLLELVPS
jgi:hypothetical protein